MGHFIIDFFEQTSMLVLLSLGFVFILSFVLFIYLNNAFQKSKRKYLLVLVSLIRATFITLLCCAFLGISLKDFSTSEKDTVLLLVDNSASMRQLGEEVVQKSLQNVIQTIRSKHQGQKILLYSLSGNLLTESDVAFKELNSSVIKVPKTIYHLSKTYSISSIYLFSDAQFDDLEGIINTHYNVNFIPFGRIIPNNTIELDVPRKTIISVPNEEISIPISLSIGSSKIPRDIHLEVFLDNQFYSKKRININPTEPYQTYHFPLKSNKIGMHSLLIKAYDSYNLNHQTISWQVVKEKAVVQAFALAPNPDLGVLNRIARNMHISLIWTFGNPTNKKLSNVLIYGDFKNKYSYDKDETVLEINSSQKESYVKNQHNNYHLWDMQMKENLALGNSKSLDSMVKAWFTQAFLKNKNQNNYYQFEKSEINEREDLIFQVESDLSDDSKTIQLKLIEKSNSNHNKTFNFDLGNYFNQFTLTGLNNGHYQAFVNSDKGRKLINLGSIRVNKTPAESILGRNATLINKMTLSSNISIIEMDQLSTYPVKEAFFSVYTSIKKKRKELSEFPVYWFTLLVLLFLEWLLRKKLSLL